LTTMVGLTTAVVKDLSGDNGSRPWHSHNVADGLRERIEWVVANRAGGNQRELARRAGLESPNHVGTILTRLRKNPERDIERETLAAIARGGHVSLRWLASGEGSADAIEVDDGDAESEPRYGTVPTWLEREARLLASGSEIPRWAYEKARRLRGLTPPVPLTDEFVETAALHAWRATASTEAIEIEKARGLAQIKRIRTRATNAAKAGEEQPPPSAPTALVLTPAAPKKPRAKRSKA
jgi:transcriptional regulator with XRE-family HTH domain